MPARVVEQKGKLMVKPAIKLIVKSSGKKNTSEGGFEHCGDDIFRSIGGVGSFCPATRGEDSPAEKRARKENVAERLVDERFFREKAEVDGPFVREDAREFEGL